MYRTAWVIIDGAEEIQESFNDDYSREAWMAEQEKSLKENECKNWEICYADTTDGFGVGELSGEEGCVYARRDD